LASENIFKIVYPENSHIAIAVTPKANRSWRPYPPPTPPKLPTRQPKNQAKPKRAHRLFYGHNYLILIAFIGNPWARRKDLMIKIK
jgi:hypothetical protein